ncbi:unnamed protein product [Linum tenue]|uniref:Aluminum-activated malate transporter 2-like n=3 Tax=Linum tenue TaxID=586396 RepID=A0AAV0Q9T1_9ROSI|nr:unnamed protein product [Linum tenue]CAI0544005.1 unnamed protein product [Linum tenue]
MPAAVKNKIAGFMNSLIELARDDPRRVIHSLKVGIALSFVSVFYYYQPLYDDFGVSAMWAVMTVVVVSEFSVGATLGKGLNRGMATLLAGALGIGAHHVANQFGHAGEPFVIGFFVFMLAAVTTFVRFIPGVKARYDYGLLIFILTFSFVSVSGYRDDEILDVAQKRVSTIMIGASVCVIVSIALFPVWAGEDLHYLIALNLEKLGNFLEGFGDEYFQDQESKTEDLASTLQDYRSILNSKNTEESLANFARWEPCHGRFQFRHPWKLYLQIGTLARQCAYRIEALNRYLTAEIQTPVSVRAKIKEPGTKMSRECGRALKEMSTAIKAMCQPCASDVHIEASKAAAKGLNSLLKSGIWEGIDLLQVTPVATVASLLIDVVNCTEKIADAVAELASKAEFKRLSDGAPSPEKLVRRGHVAITVEESNMNNRASDE